MKQGTKFSFIAVICIIIFCIAITPVTFQNDTYYSIKIGEYIMENGITHMDPFSWHEDLPYTYPHWLYDVLTYLVYHMFGYAGIYVATIILTCILGLVLYFTSKKLIQSRVIAFVLTMAAIFLAKSFITARAQLVTFILFVLTIYFIEQFLDTKKKRYPIYLIVISILIANLHVAVWPFYFVLYLPYIGEYIVANLSKASPFFSKKQIKILKRKLEKVTDEEKKKKYIEKIEKLQDSIDNFDKRVEKSRRKSYKIKVVENEQTKWLIILMLICTLTGLLTPLGDTPYTYLIKTMEGNTTQNINEHLPLTLMGTKEFLLLLIVYIAILMFTDTKIRLKDGFLLGGLILMAFSSRRQMSLVYLLCVPVLGRLIYAFLKKYADGFLEKVEKIVTQYTGTIIVFAITIVWSINIIKPKLDDKFVSESNYPVQAAEYIKNNIDLKTMRLFNEYNYGSYLLLNDIPVFIDSRADLYSPEFNGKKDIFSDFMNISNLGVYYEDKFKEYEITHVILFKKSKLNMFISRDEGYEELYSDKYFCVYQRNVPND